MALNVVGLFDNRSDAQGAVQALHSAGFSNNDISFVGNNARGDYGDDTTSTSGGSEAGEGAGIGATGGAVLGGLTGLLVGLGALVIPGIGPVVAAGTLATALGSTAVGAGIGAAAGGLTGALVGAGVPEEDANVYSEGVRRGGALLSVQADSEAEANRAAEVMNQYNVVDIDRRGEQFRSGGWNRFDENAGPYDLASDTSGSGDADSSIGDDDFRRSSKVGATGGAVAGAATGAAIGSAGGPIGTVVGGAAGALTGALGGGAADAAGVEATDNDANRTSSYASTGSDVGTAYGSTTDTTRGTTDYVGTGATSINTNIDQGGEIKVPIVEEELRVGKRQVERGGVRVYTRVQEVPVNEQVTLREETVQVQRTRVDRPVSDADLTNFQEGTVEIRERDEEAVVAKQARVVEEVHIKKNVEERAETVQDTVRRTNVDVEQISGQGRASGVTEAGIIGTQGVTGTDSTLASGSTSNEGTIESGTSRLGNAVERGTGADLDRDGDVGQRDTRNNY